ncbi:MAG: hypothetical protein R3332_07835 [Pseudohongiellaceae bacterium]|nr:hypothetical protein [Pseudohongiellaceae bacterium]
MFKATLSLLLSLVVSSSALAAQDDGPTTSEDSPIKYAIYSSAWGQRSNAGLRVVAQNTSEKAVQLNTITFEDEDNAGNRHSFDIELEVPAMGWAEVEFDYKDLLFGNECVDRIMSEDWKLVEISNYTLNPSVRGLIIEDSDSFRIYQCVRNVFVTITEMDTEKEESFYEWIMYHFERKIEF